MAKANTKIEGLEIEFKKVSSFLYANTYHLPSGKTLFRCTGRPLNIGKREFVRIFDDHLNHLDWTLDIEALPQKEFEQYAIAVEKCKAKILEMSFNN